MGVKGHRARRFTHPHPNPLRYAPAARKGPVGHPWPAFGSFATSPPIGGGKFLFKSCDVVFRLSFFNAPTILQMQDM